MNAVTFLKEKNRLTKQCNIKCSECRLSFIKNEKGLTCLALEKYCPEKVVEIVENWSREHSIKTRQSEFLKQYPNAVLEKGVLAFRPCDLDSDIECPDRDERCYSCKKSYWLKEIGEISNEKLGKI